MNWSVDPGASLPPSRQLVEKVLDALARGSLSAGEPLLSVRKMAGEALVNHNTVARAYRDLEQLGVVKGQNGRGVFITEEGPAIARSQRQQSTLQALELAAQEALRAGHSPAALRELIEGLLPNTAFAKNNKKGPTGPRKSA